MANLGRAKSFVKASPWTAPIRWGWEGWKRIRGASWIMASGSPDSARLQFALEVPSQPFLERAERRNRRPLASLSSAERLQNWYSYFSEMWPDGYEEVLKRQYESYVPLIPRNSGARVLDIGCGAGEFLRFLNERGISGMGIDLDSREVERGRARGLDIREGEAIDFLSKTDEKFAAISLIEVVEHLPLERIGPLIEAAFARLLPGGVLILETINIRHPLALDGFFIDPTHSRPVPSDFLCFMLQWGGLQGVRLVYTNPVWLPGILKQDFSRIYFNYAAVGFAPQA
jgi:SAM-dependent methyltransferase